MFYNYNILTNIYGPCNPISLSASIKLVAIKPCHNKIKQTMICIKRFVYFLLTK